MTEVLAVLVAAVAGAFLPGSPDATRLGRWQAVRRPDGDRQHRVLPGPRAWTWDRVWVIGDRAARRRRAAVIELASAMAAELGAGASPRAALAAAAHGLPFPQLAAVAASPHGDVGSALQSAAADPGGGGFVRLLACWLLCERTGGAMAPAVARVADSLRAREELERQVAAELAGPRATVVLLAVLPLFGVLMGTALGASPVSLLVGTPVGHACLTAGILLEVLGLIWTRHITRSPLSR